MPRYPARPRLPRRAGLAALAATLLPAALTAADPGGAAPAARTRNLVADYGADRARNGEISGLLQKAVDDVGAAGGGTVVIPARAGFWSLSRPVLVGYPDVTIAGEGGGTRINGGGTLLILGLKAQYPQAVTAGHFPPTAGGREGVRAGGDNVFDDSVKDRHVGLRTFDGTTRAAGFFPDCPFAWGYKIQNDPGGDYWKDYARGAGKATYWQNWPTYTINLAVRNNGAGPMKGTVCGVGAGGLTPDSTRGDIDDPLTVWTIESDPATGRNLAFRFKTVDKDGREATRSLLLSAEPAGRGVHRIGIQLDFTTGRCRAWYGASPEPGVDSAPAKGPETGPAKDQTKPNQPLLASRLDLGEGMRFKAFEYGAFHLGRVTGRMFTGSPGQGGHGDGDGDGDWTYCGLSLLDAPKYATDGDADRPGAGQARRSDGKPATDADRFFPASDPDLICYLPLAAPKSGPGPSDTGDLPRLLVEYRTGRTCDGSQGYGYWLPRRRPEPIPGMLALRDVSLFAGSSSGTAVAVAEASHVVLKNIYEGGSGFHGVGALACGPFPAKGVLEVHNCTLTGRDAALFGFDQTLRVDDVAGGGGETMFRLVGCDGAADSVIITAFVATDYYVKLHAGHCGGTMRFSQFCIDNEGLGWAPRKACFYAEPSPTASPGGSRLSFPGTLYTGSLSGDKAVIELADPPGGVRAAGVLEMDGIDLMAGPKKPARCIVLSRSDQWAGSIRLAEAHWSRILTHGLIEHAGPGRCGVVSYHDDADSLPDQGTWLEGCHVFRLPGPRDPATGAWTTKTWRCVHTGTYGTPDEPRWERSE